MVRVSFCTLGCRMNKFDTDLIRSLFRQAGYSVVDFEETADVYIINTCTVTVGGDRSSRQAIYKAKRKNPKALVVATGCYAQVRPEELARLKEVDLVVGNTHKKEILKIVEEFIEKREKKVFVGEIFRQREMENFGTVLYFENSRPFLKIQEGCNKFCSFCIIPFARGKVRSANPERVFEQVSLLAEQGYKEIVLTGTQLSQYGWDKKTSLAELLKKLLTVKKIEILRLSSLHVAEISKELLELITSESRIAPHFHLSLQSGSDRILSLMGRGYNLKKFKEIVEYILLKREESAIGTDIIVGFPSESERDFKETVKAVEEIPFAYLHIFPYSDRPNTLASRIKKKIPERIKKERVAILRDLDFKKRKEFYGKNKGRKLRAVVLSENRVLTENYLELEIKTKAKPAEVVVVRVP